jgi:tRNA threonylcarbamoyladenosine biosynthesis protein TsaB
MAGKMNTLAIDTAFKAGRIALVAEGEIKAEETVDAGHLESQTFVALVKLGIPPNLEGIDLIALAAGPGSFTGLKIGAVVVKSLSFLQKIPFKGVGTLSWLAASGDNGIVLPFIRSHGDRYYWGVYDTGGNGKPLPIPKELISPKCTDASEIIETVEASGIAGTISALCVTNETTLPDLPYEIKKTELPLLLLAQLAEAEFSDNGSDDPLTFTPLYVARSQAEEKADLAD